MSLQERLLSRRETEDDESRHFRARLNYTFVLFAMAGLSCFLLFDYFQVPNAWPTLWVGRFLLLGVCLICLALLRNDPQRPDDIALLGAVCANLYFCFGASMIEDAITLSLWNLSFSTCMLIAMPAWLVWGWRYQLTSSLPLMFCYIPIFLWLSPLQLTDLVGAGGTYTLATMIIAPALAHARSSTFQRTVKLRRALEVRNAELSHMNQQLLTQQHELEYRANHDLLTGLPNRRFGLDFLERMLAESTSTRQCMSILFVDVDRLKHVNDSFGHAEGDRLIQLVARSVAQAAGDDGLACRLGGDEFLVVMPGACDMASQQATTQLMRHLQEQRLEQQIPFPVEVSIGRVTHDPVLQADVDVDDLIHIADDRMYRQKRARRRAMAGANDPQA
ncbi:diguanylate cyclase domain-containing protein [Cobetia sp. Dlab-2-AX]|uniref:GGDEF domain-containing protein n=1 Tax=unclassified Cobetia TaxID=2609414 RepID=UPI00159E8728|nr:GGDEF domain-containing protein [Cobetia sp. Dlab-2-AX]MCO7236009.1 GGDEF domain-containing protein [Cobetia sp. Dlab-2-U]